ncbi:amino acid/polyamine transporter I [Ampelomyces quisqualis]|uniref:Amino acid/polyamine transporter I n=1 Tax=Ampelomyces quisqualis TaxID=50730 RepID=A0A6A5QIZ0_AMPQU|nr:amino acid/polyamine transporter I [Ampelomyces quisqualis]
MCEMDGSNEVKSSEIERQTTPNDGQVPESTSHLVGLELIPSDHARSMSKIEIISVGWIIGNSWAGHSPCKKLRLTIRSWGGTVGACALTLAELARVYPTAGGQYHWTSILAPKKWSRGLSYCCGVTNVFAWIAICVGSAIIMPQLVLGMAIYWNPTYITQPWHAFVLYQGMNMLVMVYNIYLLKRSMWIHDVGFFLSISGFTIINITSLARTNPNFQPAEIVWKTFLNESGWVDGIAFLTGLINPNYMYSGIDGVLHLAEECKNAAVVVPQAMMSTMCIGLVTSFIIAIVMLYCTYDFEAVVTTATGIPFFEICRQATRSDAAATVFIDSLAVMVFFALNGAHQTASRMLWSMARDDALFGSRWLKQMSPRQDVPIFALVANFAVMFVIGCIYLGSTSASNAFIGSGLILARITYAIPAALLMYRKRSAVWVPETRYFSLPLVPGWIANGTTIFVAIFALVLYSLPVAIPVTIPVTGTNMNYTIAVIGVMAIFMILNWFLYARKQPRLAIVDS